MLTTNKGYNGIYTSTQMVIPHRDIAIEIPMGWTMSWPMTGESAACCCLNGISSSLVVVVVCHAADMDWRSNWFIVLAQHPCAVLDSFDAAGVPIRTCLEWSPCCLYVFVQSIAAVSGMPVSSSIRLAFTYQQMHTSHNEQSAHTHHVAFGYLWMPPAAPVVKSAMFRTWLVDDQRGLYYPICWVSSQSFRGIPIDQTEDKVRHKPLTRSTGLQCVHCQSSQELLLAGAIDRSSVHLFVMLGKYNWSNFTIYLW